MSDIEFKTIQSNGINLRLAMMGEGPLVIFVMVGQKVGTAIDISYLQLRKQDIRLLHMM